MSRSVAKRALMLCLTMLVTRTASAQLNESFDQLEPPVRAPATQLADVVPSDAVQSPAPDPITIASDPNSIDVPEPSICDDPNVSCSGSFGGAEANPVMALLNFAGAPSPGCRIQNQQYCADNGCRIPNQKIRVCSAVITWRFWTGKLFDCTYRVYRMPQECQSTTSVGLPNCACAVKFIAVWSKAGGFGGPRCPQVTQDQFGNPVDLTNFDEFEKRGLCRDL